MIDFGKARHLFTFCVVVTGILWLCACSSVSAPTPTTFLQPAPTAVPPSTPFATLSPGASAPTWWPADLAMPKDSVPIAGPPGRAVWSTRDTNAIGIRDFILQEGARGGYQRYSIPVSAGSIYDLLLVKGGTTYKLNITQGTDATILSGDRLGTMHLLVTGAVSLDVDLPLRERFDMTPTSEIAFGTDVPNPACNSCEYLVYIHIAPFNGPGIYRTKPAGTSLVDVQLDPGGDPLQEDYRWPQECTVIVESAQKGSFACAGLENINDSAKRLNMTGSWQQPSPP